MKTNQKTYHLLILDRSGSMSNCVDSTISGFNEQVNFIQSLPLSFPDQQFFVSLILFNHDIQELFSCRTPENVHMLTHERYIPRGSTKLLDAIGHSVARLRETIDGEIEAGDATAIVSILTDGYENASREYNYDGIRKMIEDLKKTGNWTFNFLGADIDAIAESAMLGIQSRNAKSFAKSEMKQTIREYNNAMFSYAEKKAKGMRLFDFFDTEKEK